MLWLSARSVNLLCQLLGLQDMPSYQKKDVLLQLAQQMTTRKEEIARVISMEAGKPINDARIEVDVCLRAIAVSLR
jgi:acyl-CoA reductase-like NAD-dependent aldehyde dehydrogenase